MSTDRRFLTRSMSRAQPGPPVDVTFRAPVEFVRARLPAGLGVPEPSGEHGCRLRVACPDSDMGSRSGRRGG
ncbi:hypothetical protein ACFYY2_24270 [Streptomyces sp. NPDC001822]|uniref:hypothetical protein n=1 Tax=Streptomyces sp. NPDC001822 TaxID=3364614 RepID=UPI0036844EF0